MEVDKNSPQINYSFAARLGNNFPRWMPLSTKKEKKKAT